MEIYVVTLYDPYEDEVVSRKAYTKKALERVKSELIEKAKEERNERINQEDKRYGRTITERELLGSEMNRLNNAIKEAKANNDDSLYRSLRRERKKVSRRIDGIARQHRRNLWSIEREYEYKLKEIEDGSGFKNFIVKKVELVV